MVPTGPLLWPFSFWISRQIVRSTPVLTLNRYKMQINFQTGQNKTRCRSHIRVGPSVLSSASSESSSSSSGDEMYWSIYSESFY